MTKAERKDLSLKGLELFQAVARNGSLLEAAEETGLSTSTISHHLRALEASLGIELFNHKRRPMVLTPKGQAFLRNIDNALHSIRKAKAEAAAGDITDASYLRLGTIEDLDSDIIPDLAVHLSSSMPRCDFLYITDFSHTVLEMLHNRQLDLGITSTPADRPHELVDRPFLRDPFVMVAPNSTEHHTSDILAGKTDLPFLRFSKNLMVARQIESQLNRLGLSLPNRFECGNNQTLMAMVASGAGWTITTPLMFSRAKRFQDQLKLSKFPGKSFSRTLSIVTTPDCAHSIVDLVDYKLRELVSRHAISPLHRATSWLSDSFKLIS
ncbi:LysR family transcriptional regulator [Roseibium sp. SCP14]|uniref:LysR family transcriptional regulator n=1 Tax=Roseibium sp. SCP14 TaxID=3141375 RepID=UPI00333BC4C6